MMTAAVPMTEASSTRTGRRVVFATLGSWGDLQPCLAIALSMQARGHDVVLATGPCYREKIEALGVGFRGVRPDSDWVTNPELMRRRMHPQLGLIRVAREWLLPALRESYEDIVAAVEGADLLVSHPLAYAARLVAEKTGIPWVSTMSVPVGFFSAHDMAAFPLAPALSARLRFPGFWRPLLRLGGRVTRFLAEPWYRLRAEIGLPPTTENNPLSDSHSPLMVLALFSKVLADKQPDWPPQTVITGFPIHGGEVGLPAALIRFLDAGPPPIVFTLGTAVAMNAGRFYEHSITAARSVGRRAVVILNDPRNRPAALPADVAAFEYAPFSELFPRAAVVVHHGGIGTTGLAMRSGRPMLVMPSAWDQPDNAARVARLGIARVVPRHRYTPGRVASELRHLLEDPAYSRRALEVGAEVRRENGVRAACDALEMVLPIADARAGGPVMDGRG
jgi:UDP:flavonoid glycosyltransferase YjiC (YdhE family)